MRCEVKRKAELVMCNREMKIHPKGGRKEERGAECILQRPPAAYKPIAAYIGAGPGQTRLSPLYGIIIP